MLYKRYEVKAGGTPPEHFDPANEVDPVTGKTQGWIPVGDGPEDQWHREAIENHGMPTDGTYELLGPKIQGNAENCSSHHLVPHGDEILEDCPRTYDELKEYLSGMPFEGIVWHHPDGRMVKIKAKDFGIKR